MRLLTKSETCKKVGYSKQHIARLIDAKVFPPPVKPFGKNGRALWAEHELDDWIQERIKERDSTL